MIGDDELFAQVHALVDAQLAGRATDNQAAQLEELVCRDPDARALYRDYIQETVLLRALAEESCSAASRAFAPVLVDDASDELDPLAASVKRPLESGGARGAWGTTWDRMFRDAGWLDVAPAALFVCFVMVVGILIGFKLGRQADQTPPSLADRSGATVLERAAPQAKLSPQAEVAAPTSTPPNNRTAAPLATLTSGADCVWQQVPVPGLLGGSRIENAPLEAASLHLLNGSALVEFRSGAQVVLEGPAEFALLSPGEARLEHGSLVARVNSQGRGFTVRTPRAIVVDLGTEFALTAEPGGATEVHVLSGEVEVAAAADPAIGPRQRLVAGRATRLAAGQSAWSEIPVVQRRFSWPPRAFPEAPFAYVVSPALAAIQPEIAAWQVMLDDAFTSAVLDTARWQTGNLPAGRPQVSPAAGRAELTEGSGLVTTQEFDPSRLGTVRVRGRCVFAAPRESLCVTLRASGAAATKPNAAGAPGQSQSTRVECRASMVGGHLAITGIGKVQMRCDIQPGDVFDFEIRDDGRAVVFAMAQVGGDGTQAAVARKAEDRGGGHLVEFSRGGGDDGKPGEQRHIYLERVTIESPRQP